MLRTCVILALAVVLLAACGRTPDQLTVGAPEPEVVAQAGPGLHTWHPEPPPRPTTTTVAAPPPTTTTHPPSTVRAAAATPPVASSGFVNGYPCGGELPTCRVLACESGGNPTAEHGGDRGGYSTASGLWQILDSTWAGFAGYHHAADAPWQVQNQKAAQLWAGGAGRSHWAACL